MKFLKKLGWIILAILILLIILAFVLPTKHRIEVTQAIDGPHEMVFHAINDLRNHEIWSPWKDEDETMTFKLGEKVVGKGAVYTWTSENTGNGSYAITESDAQTGIQSHVVFEGQGDGTGYLNLENAEDKTKLTWAFEFTSGRFSNLMVPFMKGMMKKIFRKGLNNINDLVKERVQENKYFGHIINADELEARYYILNRQEIDTDRVQQFYASNLGVLFGKLQAANLTMAGRPAGLIYNWKENQNKVDLAAAIPIPMDVSIEHASTEAILAGPAVSVDYYGDYDGLNQVHLAIQSYLSDRNLVHNWPVIVEYVTDPGEEPDPSNWLTRVIYSLGQQ